MNEDEAFIRAIVDNPGDDTPRLVYADWLDDRDDPRGPYLRAEREAVETGDIARLRELATGLDPVWVARVSMPPVGICIEGAQITDCGQLVSLTDVAETEGRLQVTFPADYRAFLLNYNGATVRRFWYLFNEEAIYSDTALSLHRLISSSPGGYTIDGATASHRNWVSHPESTYRTWLASAVVDALSSCVCVGEVQDTLILLSERQSGQRLSQPVHDVHLLLDYYVGTGRLPTVQSFTQFLHWYLQDFGSDPDVPDQIRDDVEDCTPPPKDVAPGTDERPPQFGVPYDGSDNIPF